MRRFLFLQGPHGPFLAALADALGDAGAPCLRVGFNAGDRAFWRRPGLVAFHGSPGEWPHFLDALVRREGITDILCYGAGRWMHAEAARLARAQGLTFHVLEEGYLRPFWITYERGGANMTSPLHRIPDAAILSTKDAGPLREPPDRWGDLRAHVFWGAAYHAALLAGAGAWPAFRPHRSPGPLAEAWLHLGRLGGLPFRWAHRRRATRRLLSRARPFHLVLLQLAHDASFREGPFPGQEAFLDVVLAAFAAGAPDHHRLALKTHPLEDDREPLLPLLRRLAARHGLGGRVDLVPGGKLAPLLRRARSAVTVNSTAGQQALWHGLPVLALGPAVYARRGLVSQQSPARFFAAPDQPDRARYQAFRRFLLETSQVPGGFYSRRGRRLLLRQLPDLILDPLDPYARRLTAEASAPQLRALP